MLTHLDQVNGWSLAIGLGVLGVMVVGARVDHRIPGALVGMVASTALVGALDLQAHGVAVLGTIKSGAPHFGITGLSWSVLASLAPLAAVVALVVVTQTAATTRAFADQGGYDVDAGRDFLGVGAGSLVSGLVGSFPVNASPPRTGAVVEAGGRTQVGALGAAAAVILLIPFSGVLKDVPLATLAAILIYIASRLFNGRELLAIAHFNLFEFGLAAVTLVTVVLVGVEQGIGVAVALAILDRIRLSARPQLHRMGRIPGTTSWQRRDARPERRAGAGRRGSALRDADLVRERHALPRRGVPLSCGKLPEPVRVFVLDTIGMSDIDFTGTRAMGQVLDLCERERIAFGIARAGVHLRDSLRRSGLAARIGEDHFYPTVDAAVTALAEPPPSP